MMKQPITAVIFTYNEEKNIRHCLDSFHGLVSEILVIDSGSKDQTKSICEEYGCKVIHHAYQNHIAQWLWTLESVQISNDWILPLDADHRLTPELFQAIQMVDLENTNEIHAFYAPHHLYFWGKRVRGFKEKGMRLFHKKFTKIDRSEMVDFRFIVDGKVGEFQGALIEDNKNEHSIDFLIDKHQKFSTYIAVEEVLRRNKLINWDIQPSLFGNPDEKIVWIKNIWYKMPYLIRPWVYFFYRYIFRLGFLDGRSGFIYHFSQALWFRLMVDTKIIVYQGQINQNPAYLTELHEIYLQRFSSLKEDQCPDSANSSQS